MRIEVKDSNGYVTNVVVNMPLNNEQVALEVRILARSCLDLSNAGKREHGGKRYWRLYVSTSYTMADNGAEIFIYPETAEDFALYESNHEFAATGTSQELSCFFLNKKEIPTTPIVAWQPLVGPVIPRMRAPGRDYSAYRRQA